jgi:hypothetical protein
VKGLEPPTYGLQIRCSTIELHQRIRYLSILYVDEIGNSIFPSQKWDLLFSEIRCRISLIDRMEHDHSLELTYESFQMNH